MADYGHGIEFGYFLIPDAGEPEGVLETARLADRLGYDLLAIQDHPYQPAHLDALALLGVILAQTERIRVFQDVGNLPLRPPAMFAKAAATLDLLKRRPLRGSDHHRPRRAGGRSRPRRDPAHLQHVRSVSDLGASACARDTDEAIVGPPEHWAEVLTHFALDLGFGTFLLIAEPDRDTLRIFIEDVAPQVRARVAAARAG